MFLLVKGKIDIEAEIEKTKVKLARANEGVRRQRGIINDEGWNQKAAAAVKETERKRLGDLEAEVRALEGGLGEFERLKLE